MICQFGVEIVVYDFPVSKTTLNAISQSKIFVKLIQRWGKLDTQRMSYSDIWKNNSNNNNSNNNKLFQFNIYKYCKQIWMMLSPKQSSEWPSDKLVCTYCTVFITRQSTVTLRRGMRFHEHSSSSFDMGDTKVLCNIFQTKAAHKYFIRVLDL